MNKYYVKFINFTVSAVFNFCVLTFLIWLVSFSGIDWTWDKFIVSFSKSLIKVASNWGPLFAPSALIIYMISLFKRNIAYEVAETVSSKIQDTIKDEVKKQSKNETEQAIKSVYYGFKNNKKFSEDELYTMQCKAIMNYHSKFLSEIL